MSAKKKARYFTASEVSAHNIQSDCWVSYLGNVYDLTPLCNEFAGNINPLASFDQMIHHQTLSVLYTYIGDVLLKPIVVNAGKDISHWFNKETRDVSSCTWLVNIIFYNKIYSLISFSSRYIQMWSVAALFRTLLWVGLFMFPLPVQDQTGLTTLVNHGGRRRNIALEFYQQRPDTFA